MDGIAMFETFWQDLSYASRMMRHRPGFTATVLVTLALGVGGKAAAISIVQTVLLQPSLIRTPSRLVAIWDRNLSDSGVSKMFSRFKDFWALADHAKSFDKVAAGTRSQLAHYKRTGILIDPLIDDTKESGARGEVRNVLAKLVIPARQLLDPQM